MFSGKSSSPEFGSLRSFAADLPMRAQLTSTSDSPSTNGFCLAGTAASSFVTRSAGMAYEISGHDREPSHLFISDTAPTAPRSGRRLWLGTDATPQYGTLEGRRAVSVRVPIASLTVDLKSFDLHGGSVVGIPPIAMHVLQGLAGLVESGVDDWVPREPSAIDRYLIEVVGLILAATLDDRPSALADHADSWICTRARSIIESQHADPAIDPARIAAKLGISIRSLYRAFADGVGVGVAELLRTQRATHAAVLLATEAESELPIAEIARQSGFISTATFERVFVATYGISPTEYRADHVGASG